ncbi:Oidioi.mRNA.OKI2018_I69.PAR.g10981.t1.cds [Oikopleura dioica]|uniref:Oidioi.mRNA.OKI2018_I69.PAR.g10981.t1.cds n=1 Tax=Oikopleura dioica TaxID=34765 RepID=A0ABN7RWP1_OIKDI|nr:Oidioi.mRNA.OKI2018_I69.PAR.g10981.t1.cds [Oikopleura dioica]
MNIVVVFQLVAVISARSFHHFCSNHQMKNLINLSNVVKQVYENDILERKVFSSRRRRHHPVNVNAPIDEFFVSLESELSMLQRELEYTPSEMVVFTTIADTVRVMNDLVRQELTKKELAISDTVRSHKKLGVNSEFVRERVSLKLSKLVNSFLSIKAQCNL